MTTSEVECRPPVLGRARGVTGHELVSSQQAKYVVVGATCTTLDFLAFNALMLAGALSPSVAKLGATAAAVGLSFVLNRNWTFKKRTLNARSVISQFSAYVCINLLSAVVSVLCLRAAESSGFDGLLWLNVAAFGSVLVVGTVLRFVVYRRFVFA